MARKTVYDIYRQSQNGGEGKSAVVKAPENTQSFCLQHSSELFRTMDGCCHHQK